MTMLHLIFPMVPAHMYQPNEDGKRCDSWAIKLPQLHFFPNGNYVACNQYWAVGLDCPHHEERP